MPPAKPKPSDIAAEAKRHYIPYIERTMYGQYPSESTFYLDSSSIRVTPELRSKQRLRVAVIDGDPVDVALGWYRYNVQNSNADPNQRVPVVNVANERRPGGDWESGLMAPEECFARRSNLVQALNSFNVPGRSCYPLPPSGGIYSPNVVVFRDGPEQYQVWREFESVPVISVAPVKRPKLDESGTQYSFEQEKELMAEKMRTVLRIAARHHHKNICLGAFGVGPVFRNPIAEVAKMWRKLLFEEKEFNGVFANVVFAIETNPPGIAKGAAPEYDVFQREFDPSNIFPTTYR